MQIVSNLRAAHGSDPSTRMGVDILTGGPGDMRQLGINESFRVKQQVGERVRPALVLRYCCICHCLAHAVTYLPAIAMTAKHEWHFMLGSVSW